MFNEVFNFDNLCEKYLAKFDCNCTKTILAKPTKWLAEKSKMLP